MTSRLLARASAIVAFLLGILSLRRALLLAAAVMPARRLGAEGSSAPSVTLVVPARNEARGLERLLACLERLEYLPELLFTVLVDDASEDGGAERLARWAEGRPRAAALRLSRRLGKSGAVNEGLAVAPPSDLVAVLDADVRPWPACLARLVSAFADESVGVAFAYRRPDNAAASPIARYAAVESWVTQLVAAAAKDRLDLNPSDPGGLSAYRHVALERAGGFRPRPGEDVRLSVALTLAGWRTRFVRGAVVDETVVHRLSDYWHQHIRWARNLLATAGQRELTAGSVTLPRRIESWMVSAGYADRLILLVGLPLAAARKLPLLVPGAYVAVVACEIAVALAKTGRVREAPRFLFFAAVFFPLDVAASAAAALLQLLRRPRTWRHPERPPC